MLNNNMVTFKEFFLKEHIMFGKVVNPRHMRSAALFKTGLKTKSAKLVAKRHSDKDYINRDRNTRQKTGVITPDEAEELISTHGLNKQELQKGIPVGLGKRPFQLSQHLQTKQYMVTRKN
jgi:hypothetical protein